MSEAQPSESAPAEGCRLVIQADDREAESGVIECLRALPGVDVQVLRLSLGDYLVEGYGLFERKTVADFAASVTSGHLFDQAVRLANSSQPATLILEGGASALAGIQVRREALQGAMVSLGLIFRIPVLRSRDPAETARLLVYAGDQLRRHEEDRGLRPGRRPKGKRRRQLWILQGLPGVGPERARQLLEVFGSVESVMNARQAELEELDGIGPKTAQGIREILQETPPNYGGPPRDMPDL
jgi:DNA excision repair protein ERCC-4